VRSHSSDSKKPDVPAVNHNVDILAFALEVAQVERPGYSPHQVLAGLRFLLLVEWPRTVRASLVGYYSGLVGVRVV
jgi:hypothetical protein